MVTFWGSVLEVLDPPLILGFWRVLEVFGGFWGFLGVFGGFEGGMVLGSGFGCFWGFGTSFLGCFWRFWVRFG